MINERLLEISKYVDKTIKNDYINTLLEKYTELKDYTFIKTIEEFSLLSLKGSMKYINKYDKKLRNGGLLIKIYKKNEEWYAIIKKQKFYHISFNKNYIFYLETKSDLLRSWAECFISDVNNGKYK